MWNYNDLDELYHFGVLGMRWGQRRANRDAKITRQVNARKQKAIDKVNRIANKKPNSTKVNKAAIKATKINASRYGQTRGQIYVEGVLKSMRNTLIGSTAAAVAMKRGKANLAGNIMNATVAVNTVQGAKTTYKLLTNYKPRKTSAKSSRSFPDRVMGV